MADIVRNNKPLSERPLKTSAATGAALAAMGFRSCIPLMHGSQGCGAFSKVYLIQHFREPMPIQNTAVDHIAAVMGSDENLQQAITHLQQKHSPEMILISSTGLTELQGSDLQKNVRDYYAAHPSKPVQLAAVNTPDFSGSLQSGFAAAVEAVLKAVLTDHAKAPVIKGQVNVICSSAMTAADIDLIRRYIDSFGLRGIFIPDLSSSLDGHLDDGDYSPTSTGGCSIFDLKDSTRSELTLVMGESMRRCGQWLEQTFNVPCMELPRFMGLENTDHLVSTLQTISGRPVPQWIQTQRRRLQDCLLDTHFVLSGRCIALAVESDLLLAFDPLFSEIGIQSLLGVTCNASQQLEQSSIQRVIIGDHADLDLVIDQVDALVGNTHCAEFYEPEVPVLRAGFPCHDRFGNSDRLQVGYEGARQQLFQLANLMLAAHRPEVEPYISPYRNLKREAVV